MAKIKVSSVTKGEPPCPQPAPKPAPMKRPAPTDPKHGAPPPPPFFAPGPCCPAQQQVVDNITVKSLDENKIEVIEGSYLGMKAYGIDAKTFSGIGTTGMVPPPKKGDEKKVLQADGTWVDNPEQEQADWRQNDRNAVDYIKNKPGAFKGIGTSGFVPKPVVGDEGKVLSADGTWYKIPDQKQADWRQNDRNAVDFIKNKPGAFKGIGTSGFVPKPVAGDEGKVLASDGSWAEILIPEQEQADWKQTDRNAVDYIKNKPNLNVYATKTELNTKVDKVDGKGLSTNDYTNAEKSKLAGVQAGAEKNVQSDWKQTNTSADDFIKNKPTIPVVDQTYNPNSANAQSGKAVASAVAGKQNIIPDLDTIRAGAAAGATAVQPSGLEGYATEQYVNDGLSEKVDKVEGKQLSTEDYTTEEKTKLNGIESGAQVNVQSDWNQTDESADDFIKNKPDALNVDQVFDPTSPRAQSGTAVAGAISGKQDTITDLETIRSGAAAGSTALQPSALEGYATESYVDTGLNTKQDTIDDLATIRSGAEAGSTAVQPGELATVATTGSYDDLSDTPDLDVYATKTEVATGLSTKMDKLAVPGNSTYSLTVDGPDGTPYWGEWEEYVAPPDPVTQVTVTQSVSGDTLTLTPSTEPVTLDHYEVRVYEE